MIKITQVCDACQKQRPLVLKIHGSTRKVSEAAREGGWREIKENKHLCNNCINDLVN